MNLPHSAPADANTNTAPGSKRQIILASQSPRRKTLLEQLGLAVICHPVDIDETPLSSESPSDLVVRLALGKASRCYEVLKAENDDAEWSDGVIIGADTTIDLDNHSLGKPISEADGLSMLRQLSGREHLVHTGICVLDQSTGEPETQLVTTTIRFAPISESQAQQYWDSGEPIDKAGGYAIQGLGARFVAHLSGSYSNVVGLPLYETLGLVEKVS